MKDAFGNGSKLEEKDEKRGSLDELLNVVNVPNSTVGLGTAYGSSSNVSDISFTNWRTELRNLLAGMRPVNWRHSDADCNYEHQLLLFVVFICAL